MGLLRGKQWFGYFRQTVLDPETGEERVKKVCVKLALKTKMTNSKRERRYEPKSQNALVRTSEAESKRIALSPSSGLSSTATFRSVREIGGRRRRKRRWPRSRSTSSTGSAIIRSIR